MIYLGIAVYWFVVVCMVLACVMCIATLVYVTFFDRDGSSMNGGPR